MHVSYIYTRGGGLFDFNDDARIYGKATARPCRQLVYPEYYSFFFSLSEAVRLNFVLPPFRDGDAAGFFARAFFFFVLFSSSASGASMDFKSFARR